jgi:6-phosphogluconolactonase (cycloisomerase 2 family)
VNSNGSLTAVAGSPFAFSTNNQNIVTNGSNLYAIDPSDSNLNVFSINRSTGSLSLAATTSALAGDPNSSMYSVGLALDHTGSSLYVNLGISDEDSGINLFTVGSGATAQEVKFLDTGAYAEPPLVFSPNNQYGYSSLCTARVIGVFAYARASDGTLTSIKLGDPPGPTGISGVGFCPGPLAVSAKGYVALVWLPDAMGSSVPSNQPYVMTYTMNSDGTLTVVSNSQTAIASTSSVGAANAYHTIALNFDPSGSVLAVAGNGGVQTYSLNGNGMLTPAGAAQNAGVSFQSVAWDNANHVFAASSSELYVYNSASGVLTPAAGSPNPGDQNVAVLPLQ